MHVTPTSTASSAIAKVLAIAPIALLLLLASSLSFATTFTVNNRFDVGSGGCTATECTLREALIEAQAAGSHVINFSFAANAHLPEVLIQPASPLPTITQALTLNGYSVAASSVNTDPQVSNAVLRIRIDGLNAGTSANGLAVCHGSVTIRGVSITRFARDGINIGHDNAGATCALSGNVVVQGSFIGLGSNGTTAAGNLQSGIEGRLGVAFIGANQADVTTFLPADRNVIGANGGSGILLNSVSFARVVGNLIGTDRTGAVDRGNVGTGILLSTSTTFTQIGLNLAPNLIRFNANGIATLAASSINGNFWTANRIYDNDALGIDLGNDGVTANDVDDSDTGPNGLQNFPQLTSANRTADGIHWIGTLDVPAALSGSYTLSFFANSSCDASLRGEGEIFLGSRQYTTLSQTNQIITDSLITSSVPPGSVLSMTANGVNGTSEFSNCVAIDAPSLIVNSTDDVADGVCNAAHCSLREAITFANLSTTSVDLIEFNIVAPASGELLIRPNSPLPKIVSPLTINGYTQAGQPRAAVNTDPDVSNAVLRIRVDGANAGASASGFQICAGDVTIKGLSVTGFAQDGIAVGIGCTSTGFVAPINLLGNFIGLATDGSTAAGNGGSGLRMPPVQQAFVNVGSSAVADRNVISANLQGLSIEQANVTVVGNLIGTGRDGLLDRGNSVAGILIPATGATGAGSRLGSIGSNSAPNLIRFNGDGIQALNNGVWPENRFSNNDDLGIDLGNDGVTGNDPDDGDLGPNKLQNFPAITLAERSDLGIRIVGTLDVPFSTSNQPYRITVYANSSCAANHGQGERLLGSATVNLTQGTGETFAFELSTADALEPGVQITTTATGQLIEAGGSTFASDGSSEFSACVAATDAPPGIVVNSALDVGATPTCDFAECTLREAIAVANNHAGVDLIRFEIPGDGPFQISLSSLLPAITETLTIDGYTQLGASANSAATGSDAVLQIELSDAAGLAYGLATCATGEVLIRGLAFTRFSSGAAIATRMNAAANCAVSGGSVRVQGNYFGVLPDGTAGNSAALLRNAAAVAATETVATIGGTTLADRNIISNSNLVGVNITGAGSSGSIVQNNLIGSSASPVFDLGNFGAGVEISGASNVTVGGEGVLSNLIAFNGLGVLIHTAGAGNRAYANAYNFNDGLGIDLSAGGGANGVTVNDGDDADVGPNNLQNFPALSGGSAASNSITLSGTLDVPANVIAALPYRIAFYESLFCDPSGQGEGSVYLGSQLVDLANSAEAFAVTLSIAPTSGPAVITATATDPTGNTSEFSSCVASPRLPTLFSDGFE